MSVLMQLNAQELTLMTYNIRYDNPADGDNAWPLRKECLSRQILAEAPDVLGIQEGLYSQLLYLDSEFVDYQRVGVGRDDGQQQGEFSAVYFRRDRFRLDSSATFWLSQTPDVPSKAWDAALPRICTWAALTDLETGRPFAVMNTHFDHIGSIARLNSALLLLSRASAFESSGRTVFMMGDFNCGSQSEPILLITSRYFDGMQSRSKVGFSDRGTYNAFDPGREARERIDFIFHSDSGIQVKEARIVTAFCNSGRYPSDHFPVMTRYSMKEE